MCVVINRNSTTGPSILYLLSVCPFRSPFLPPPYASKTMTEREGYDVWVWVSHAVSVMKCEVFALGVLRIWRISLVRNRCGGVGGTEHVIQLLYTFPLYFLLSLLLFVGVPLAPSGLFVRVEGDAHFLQLFLLAAVAVSLSDVVQNVPCMKKMHALSVDGWKMVWWKWWRCFQGVRLRSAIMD